MVRCELIYLIFFVFIWACAGIKEISKNNFCIVFQFFPPSIIFLSFFLWCLVIFMSSRRRLSDAETSRPRCYERLAATEIVVVVVVGCTDTRARPITGPSSPPPETQAIYSPGPYPWPWSCPCRPSANQRHRQRFTACPMRRHRRDEGI